MGSEMCIRDSNYEKKLISGEVKKFGREEVVNCIIRNLWNNYKVKVPYKIKEHANEMFRSEHDKLHDMVASTSFVLRKHHKLDKFEEEINNEFGMFVIKSVMKLNSEFNDAYNYYQQLSQEYYTIVFGMDTLKLLNDPIMFFDATKAFKEEVSQQVERIAESTGKILKFMNQDVTKELMKKLFAEIKINVKTAKAIKNDLHETVDRYIVRTKGVVFEEIEKTEEKLLAIEILSLIHI